MFPVECFALLIPFKGARDVNRPFQQSSYLCRVQNPPMPTKITTSTATPVVVAAEATEPMVSGLQFNEPLSWRAGKPIAIADLLRRLQALFKEMRGMEQEENERDSFTTVATELASPNLLGHKDKGVKAWTACCLVEILRLCAPDAPYTGQQLKVRQNNRTQ